MLLQVAILFASAIYGNNRFSNNDRCPSSVGIAEKAESERGAKGKWGET